MTTDERAALIRALVSELVTTETLHLDYELIEKFADRRSDAVDCRIVESHIALCTMCGREVREMEAFAARKRRNRAWVFAAMAAVGIALIAALTPLLRSSPTVLSLRDNDREIRLTHDGRLAGVAGITPAEESRISSALRGAVLIPVSVATHLSPASQSDDPRSAPSGCILDDQPVIQWTAIPGARYRVDVLSDELRPVASGVTNANQWMLPTALGRGATYVWRVSALAAGEARLLHEARFSIVTQKAAEEIQRLERVQPRSHLALGLAYAEAGIVAEAERELSALASENPGSAEAQRLLLRIKGRSE